jgi:maleylpyruvate isomerase
MGSPFPLLQGLRASTSDLLSSLPDLHWSEDEVAAPSLCEGWTRGHVLTHLAQNAAGIADTLSGALRGEIVERYPGGWDARNAAIEAGANRPYAALAADVRDSAERLDRVFGAVDDAGTWDRPTDKGHPARHWLRARWQEVEIHRVDLDAGYTPERWPPALVTLLLGDAGDALESRADGPVRVRIVAEGSLAPEHVGRTWTVGSGSDAVEVAGPDWAVLAWLVGRPSVAEPALTAAPPLRHWH